jgi:chemosensory pili system protein ChpB (putative protein-glutamate methylesterase)
VAELQLGLVVDTASKQIPLTQLILQAGHRVVCHWVLSAGAAPDLIQPQAWLLDISSDYEGESPLVDQLLNQDQVPVLLIDSSEAKKFAEGQAWMKRTQHRLQQLAGDIELQKNKAANECWILAASTGGPAAVNRFIQELPMDLSIAFLYVQHIDPRQGESLARSMNRSAYICEVAENGSVLSAGKILLLTSKERIEVLSNKTLCLHKDSVWNGNYVPSINQLVANVASIYKQACGLIIFTGMGDDGAASCRLLSQQGGVIWAQSPESSTSDSMPQAAIATNCVSFVGTPEQLAQALATRHALS